MSGDPISCARRAEWSHPARVLLACCALAVGACGDDSTTAPGSREPATQIRLTTPYEIAAPGTAIDTVFATVTDRFDKRVAGAPVAWVVELGGGSVRALASTTDAQGIARAIWTLGTNVGNNALTATSGLLTDRLTAIASTGFAAVAVAVGGEHACALIPSGAAYCWGSNREGQLGGGTTDDVPHTSPSRVVGGHTFKQLVAGTFHTCGLTAGGVAYCWGADYSGQLGSFVFDVAVGPTRVPIAQPLAAITAGAHHTCGLTIQRTIYCWGDNTAGEIGDGSDRSAAVPWGLLKQRQPAQIVGGRSFLTLASTFSNTCAAATTGQTYCWGSNQAGELGTAGGKCRMLADQYYFSEDWDLPCSTTPVPINSQESLTSLTASGLGVCGLTTAGGLVCWGSNYLPPTVIPDVRVSAAWSLGHIVCGVETSNAVSCWGLGHKGPRTQRPFGDAVTLVNLSSMGSTSCGVSRGPSPIAYCWGHNYKGQAGNETLTYHYIPVAVGLPRR